MKPVRKPAAPAAGDTAPILATDRLWLRRLTLDDARFILRLVNEPSWLEFIGDKGVRNEDDARVYLERGPLDLYVKLGFGLYLVELKAGGTPIGICGLIKRESLPDVDIGFAYLPEFQGQGYAHEAACAVLAHARNDHALKRIVAITSPRNQSSIRLLEKLGMAREQELDLPRDGGKSLLFGRAL